ncbi:MAG: hypothetical protein HFH68_06165 [Lachnospiraceae bacterium]|nr:hypothetical protein [Lachnospiraceae bacterium]
MLYELVAKQELQEIYDVVCHTVKTVYPKYYLFSEQSGFGMKIEYRLD